MVKAFRCSHSGKYYPADYSKEWGRKYGIGLGPHPVSECLDSDYRTKPVGKDNDPESMMHPMGVTLAQIDYVEVDEAEYEANKLILAINDPDYSKRVAILKKNQEKKSPGLRALRDELRKQREMGVI